LQRLLLRISNLADIIKKDKGGKMRTIYKMIEAYLLEYIKTRPIDFILYSILISACTCLLLLIMVVILIPGTKAVDKESVKELAEDFMTQT